VVALLVSAPAAPRCRTLEASHRTNVEACQRALEFGLVDPAEVGFAAKGCISFECNEARLDADESLE
jgi:hypothetical protein